MLYVTFFQEKKAQYSYIGFFLFYVVVSLEYIFIDLPILTLALNFIGLFILAQLYHPSISRSIICTAFSLALTCFTECIIMPLSGYTSFSFNENGFYSSYVGITIEPILLFLFCLIFRQIKRSKAEYPIPLSQNIITFIIPLSCLFIVFQLFSFSDIANWQFICIIALLMFLSFSTIWLYDKQLVFYEKEQQNKLLTLQNQFFHNEIEHMSLLEESTRKVRHDLKNHFLSINLLAQSNHDQDVSDYINAILTDLEPSIEYVCSGNFIINGLCNYYITIAKKYDISVTYDISFPEDITINENDITILLGNIWNNCIENTKNSLIKEIDFQLLYDKNRMIISAKNTFTGLRKKIGNTFISTKSDIHHHGIGLKNMRQIVENYEGIMKLNCENGVFQVNIIIYLS
jgi:hypothetical protein